MKKILIFLFLISFVFANNTNDLKEATKLYNQKKYQQALKVYRKLAKKGDLTALNNEAMLLYLAPGKILYKQGKAVKLLQNAINTYKKIPPKMYYNLAVMYYNGYVDENNNKVIVDRKKALFLFLKAIRLRYKPAKIFYDSRYTIRDTNTSSAKKK